MTSLQINESVTKATQFQQKASDPARSAWVSANAGSGKTYVLVNRIIRLMLDGVSPEKILCLTFTKAAAAEMSNRLFERLSEWIPLDDEALAPQIERISGTRPDRKILQAARKLFARSLETPGGLKIQTIHGFCESLLHRFPIEAGLSPGFKVLEDAEARVMKEEARNAVLARAMKDRKSPLGQAVSFIVARAEGDRFDHILDHILRCREKLIQNIDQSGLKERPDILTSQADLLRTYINQTHRDRDGCLAHSFLADENFEKEKFGSLVDCLLEGGKRDKTQADHLKRALQSEKSSERLALFEDFFLTKSGGKKSESFYMSKKAQDINPDLAEWAFARQQDYVDLRDALNKLDFIEINSALYLLADAIYATYRVLKHHRGSLDFDDLITYSCDLFKRVSGAWVLYKIDGGLDHILVDEAQDTSGAQWQIISAIAEEFFVGEGTSVKERTIFAVGDEKQSIYSFQGAEPSQFDKMRHHFERQARSGACAFEKVPLSVSFRSTSRVLNLVDDVFKNPQAARGLTHSGEIDEHMPTRAGQAGRIELWDTVKPQDAQEPDPWDAPLDWQNPESPSHLLANKIARKIRGWLDNKEILEARGRPIEPGDILILVRKRKAFFEAMLRALKIHNIPVAGADRMVLSEQIAVMDLIALGRFTLLPEDDLTLACLLKSPLFGISEEQLFEVAYNRNGSLWEALEGSFPDIFETLTVWRDISRASSVFDFYSCVLNTKGGRQKIVARLGEEANDPIDEFLSLALAYDQTTGIAMQDFLHRFSKSEITIKRDMEHGKNEVRLMTVHGAKGLEGNIVFLPETCSVPKPGNTSFTSLGGEEEELLQLPVWALDKRQQFDEISRALENDKELAVAEYRRLLYVALTRARDRLYVCGFEDKRKRDESSWYDLVKAAVTDHAEEQVDEDGDSIWCLQDQQERKPEDNMQQVGAYGSHGDLPSWTQEKISHEEYPPRPLVPSRLDRSDEGVIPSHQLEQSILSPLKASRSKDKTRFKRGNLIHNLLQYLPNVAPEHRRKRASEYLKHNAQEFDKSDREQMIEEVSAVLENEVFATLFGPQSKSEVPVSALIGADETGGHPLAINGQIDRLVVTQDEVLIIDYKTNRPPPQNETDVAPLYVRQMAAYRLILKKVYPDHHIKCALLWTYELRLMPLSEALLEKALKGVGGT